MIERLENIEKRYNELTQQLMNPEIISNIKKTLELTREQSSLSEAYEAYQEYKKVLTDLSAANEMLKDSELAEFAKDEIDSLNTKKKQMEDDFQ